MDTVNWHQTLADLDRVMLTLNRATHLAKNIRDSVAHNNDALSANYQWVDLKNSLAVIKEAVADIERKLENDE